MDCRIGVRLDLESKMDGFMTVADIIGSIEASMLKVARFEKTHAVRSPKRETIEEKCSPTVSFSNGGYDDQHILKGSSNQVRKNVLPTLEGPS